MPVPAHRELAELLGQVKPPTATRDDIEKSGLKTFKASALSEYEQTGKVSNNCVDRVSLSRRCGPAKSLTSVNSA